MHPTQNLPRQSPETLKGSEASFRRSIFRSSAIAVAVGFVLLPSLHSEPPKPEAKVATEATKVPIQGELQTKTANGLVAHFSCSKAPESGTVTNEAGAGAAVAKSEPLGPGPGWKPDQGGYLLFEGMDFLELPKTLTGRKVFSLSLWFRADAEGVNMVLLGAEGKFNLELSNDKQHAGHVRWGQRADNSQSAVFSDKPPVPGIWHHVAITCDGINSRMYVDGGLQERSAASTEPIHEEGGSELVGAYRSSHPAKWIGALKDLRFYDQPLDAAGVSALYENGRGSLLGVPPAPVLRAFAASNKVPEWKSSQRVDYLRLVRAYADTMIEKGRDVYGPERSPLFAAALNRENFRIGSFPSIPGMREYDRITTGANPMTDQNLYQVFYALSQITGDQKYREEADRALSYFFQHAQSPVTGLLAWGEHMGWDFKTEGPIRDMHEYFRPWVLWELSYRLAPETCLGLARGLWDHQIHDQKTGNFSRHGGWSKHETRPDWDFPRHAGFYIATWAEAYRRSKDPVFAQAIETLVTRYDRKRAPESGAIPAASNMRDFRFFWPQSNLSMAVDLTNGASGMPEPLAASMNKLAGTVDETYLRLKHDGGDGRFFVTFADVGTLEPKLGNAGKDPYAGYWAAGYGDYNCAQQANACYLRYQQLPDGAHRTGYQKLILATADLYLHNVPDTIKTLYPGAVGGVIWNLLNAYEISGDHKYQDRAAALAANAADSFFKGGCPLPTASSSHAHYEAITRGDTLMMVFLRLWNSQQQKPTALSLVYTDR